ncbi:GNAT family N-acetyltransferase [Streptomyces ossamyceticus]|uniref:GNAT family N-acetyltransferase n=1 Tax=Streptomyces ossamyceticus TaxID=249581 RepID=UPI003EBF1FE3
MLLLETLRTGEDGTIPGSLLAELTALHASNRAFYTLSGDFPDPDDIRPEQVDAALALELANPDVEILLARDAAPDSASHRDDTRPLYDNRPLDGAPAPNGTPPLVGIVITLAHHPDPADPDPWIGLLLVDAAAQRRGHGRRLAALVETRLRQAGRTAVRLAALDNNPGALAFWTSLGYEIIAHRADRQRGRPCTVLRKLLAPESPTPPA